MSTNSRFTIAIHALTMMARENRPLSSSQIAHSVNTNPVTIRKILCSLSNAGLINTLQGAEGGSMLARPAQEISLLDVYHATEQAGVFTLYPSTPNDDCPCGRHMEPVLAAVFSEAEAAMTRVLAGKSLTDIMHDVDTHLLADIQPFPQTINKQHQASELA